MNNQTQNSHGAQAELTPSQSGKVIQNSSLLKFGGVIGRRDYLINYIIVVVYSVVVAAVFMGSGAAAAFGFAERAYNPTGAVIIAILCAFAWLATIPVLWSLNSRRIRDIRGTHHDHWLWFGGLVVASFVPILNVVAFVMYLALFFWPGKITNPSAVTRYQQKVSNPAIPIEVRYQSQSSSTGDKLSRLNQLNDLRVSGAINQDEFEKMKAEILREGTL